jgi:MFS family permease
MPPARSAAAPARQIPGGWAASRYGGERVLTVSFLLWSSASLLTPSDGARTRALYATRVLVGAAMGVVFPSIHSILVHWIPPHERSRAVSLFTSGMYFGSAFGMLVLPVLIAARGPGAVPVAVGAAGLAWLLLWSRFAGRRPGAASPSRCAVASARVAPSLAALTRLAAAQRRRAAAGPARRPQGWPRALGAPAQPLRPRAAARQR